MKAIMTVTGIDHVGIIASVASALASAEVNIINVSQTLMGEYFTMIMQLELDTDKHDIETLQHQMRELGQAQGLVIRIQSEAIFNAMHKL